MKKIILILFVSLFVCEVRATESSIERPLDEKAQLQLQMYPTPMEENEKKEICQLVKDGKYEEIQSVTYQEAGINEKDLIKKLVEENFPYTESIYNEDKVVTITDYNNDGKEDKLIRFIYDRTGGNGNIFVYYLILDDEKLEPLIYTRPNGNIFFWRSSINKEKTYWHPYSSGQRIIKVKGKNYLATLDRDPYFDKIKQNRPDAKYKRTIVRVDLIMAYPDGKNINHIVCEF